MNARTSSLTVLAFCLTNPWGQAQVLESVVDSINPAVSQYPFDYEGISGLDDNVGALVFSDISGFQVIKMIEELTDHSILLPAANKLPQLTATAITFNSRKPLTKGEALIALESLLSMHGTTLTRINDHFWKAVPTAGAAINKQVPIWLEGRPSLQPPSEKIYTTLFELDYLPANDEIKKNLVGFGSDSHQLVLFENANSILVTDSLLNLQRIERLIKDLDRPAAISEKIFFIKTEHVNVADVQKRLGAMAKDSLKRYLGSNTKFDHDERTGQLIVVTHPAHEERIREFIKNLDIRVEPDTNSKVFDIQNADAVEVQKLLSEIIGQQQKVQQQAKKRAGSTSGSTVVAAPTPPKGASTPAKKTGTTPPKPTAATTAATTSAGGTESAEQNLQFSEFVATVADPRSNSILAYGTKSDLTYIEDLIRQIDVQLPQVKIEVIIAEVTLTHNETRGIDIFRAALDAAPDPQEFPATAGLGHNGLAAIISQDALSLGGRQNNTYFDAILDIAKNDGRVEVLSTPNIVATHNQEAEINVSQAEPIVTGVNSDTTGINYRSNIQYRDIGIQLKVKPLIGSNGLIQMEIEQTVENVVGRIDVDQQNKNQPIIGKRSASSYVAVRDGEVIVLAGLQESKPSETIRRTPILSSIPGLKKLFTRRSIENTKRDLIFFIRPEIVSGSTSMENTLDRLNINEELKEAIRSGDPIPDEDAQDEKDRDRQGDDPDEHSTLPSSKVVRIDFSRP